MRQDATAQSRHTYAPVVGCLTFLLEFGAPVVDMNLQVEEYSKTCGETKPLLSYTSKVTALMGVQS
jgi:hypothetical protein